MDIQHYFPTPQIHIPFTLKDRQGRVAVYYGLNDDAVKAGFDAIPGINFPLEQCLGYPVMYAVIDNYEGTGYRTLCGWIQIITRVCGIMDDKDHIDIQRSYSVDLVPAMSESKVPFVVYGNLPSIFDAPCLNLGHCTELTWIADTFLTTVPLRSRQEDISWLMGFRWGYREYDPSTGKPVEMLHLEAINGQIWNHHLPFLRREFSNWQYTETK